MLLDGCHEGKHTPRLTEVKCSIGIYLSQNTTRKI